jgi:hypothetical protein
MSERVFRVTVATGYTANGVCRCAACQASRGVGVRQTTPTPRVQPPAAPDLAARIKAERARVAQAASESWGDRIARVAAIFGIKQVK